MNRCIIVQAKICALLGGLYEPKGLLFQMAHTSENAGGYLRVALLTCTHTEILEILRRVPHFGGLFTVPRASGTEMSCQRVSRRNKVLVGKKDEAREVSKCPTDWSWGSFGMSRRKTLEDQSSNYPILSAQHGSVKHQLSR